MLAFDIWSAVTFVTEISVGQNIGKNWPEEKICEKIQFESVWTSYFISKAKDSW